MSIVGGSYWDVLTLFWRHGNIKENSMVYPAHCGRDKMAAIPQMTLTNIFHENCYISIQLEIVPNGSIMDRWRTGDKLLSEPMRVYLIVADLTTIVAKPSAAVTFDYVNNYAPLCSFSLPTQQINAFLRLLRHTLLTRLVFNPYTTGNARVRSL